jgi:SAM-dependent methyltransferase
VSGEPARWLDVGGGFGHFCWAAREVFPKTRFECLDMGASVEEAARRGWADASHRGQLPELASKLAGQFDVVSLLHCLEHSRDPRAEIAAAFDVLAPGGRLLIEVPDPECIWRRVLGPLWMPYFQPQHLHLLSVDNLSRLLREKGYVVERSERSKLGDNFTLALLLLVNRLDPEDSPWLPPKSSARAALGAVLRALATPLFVLTWLVDRLIRAVGALPHSSNAFRVLARKPS